MKFPGTSIRTRLLLASVVPLLVVVAALAFMSYRVAAAGMEEELGLRLVTVASAAASLPDLDLALALYPGGEGTRTYLAWKAKFDALRATTGVRSVILLDREGNALVASGAAYGIGDKVHRAAFDATEIAAALKGDPAASVMFTGSDGTFYKTGYAPARAPGTAEVRGVVAAEGSARHFALLGAMRSQFLVIAGLGALLLGLAMFLVARMIARPISDLAGAARAIGLGDIHTPVRVRGRDEVGLLGATMEEMRAEIEGRDRHMQMMLSGVAHEIRNPLGGMELFAGLLKEDVAGNTEALQRIARIERELNYLTSVVNSFLDYTRKAKTEPREIDPRPILEDARWAVLPDAEARGLTLSFDCGPATITCDPEGFKRAVLNLVKNAVQATPKGGAVTATLAAEGAGFTLTVRDTGAGIPPDKLHEIFRPFYTTRERGTGLGLAFVKKFADEHDGAVDVRSDVGGGSTFTVTVPAR